MDIFCRKSIGLNVGTQSRENRIACLGVVVKQSSLKYIC